MSSDQDNLNGKNLLIKTLEIAELNFLQSFKGMKVTAMNKRAHPNVNPIHWIIGHCMAHMYANLQHLTKEISLSEEILYFIRGGANVKEIKEIFPFSIKNLIDDYIKISTKFFEYLNDMPDDQIFEKPSDAYEKWYERIQRIALHFMGHTGEIFILRKEIEGRGSIKQRFFVDGVNENLRKRLKDEWLRWWDENKHDF